MVAKLQEINQNNLNPEVSQMILELQTRSNINKKLLIKNTTTKKLEESWTESIDLQ